MATRLLSLGFAAGLALGMASHSAVALADAITFNLTTPNSGINQFDPPFASVTVNRTSATTATLIFTSQTNANGNVYLFGGAQAIDVNVNGPFSVSNILGTNSGSGFSSPSYTVGGSGHADGFGVFSLTIDAFDGYSHAASQVQFDLTDLGATWTSAASVLTQNAGGHLAAAHIFVSPTADFTNALATGFATGTELPSAPEPQSLPVFASGIVSLALWRLMQKRRRTRRH